MIDSITGKIEEISEQRVILQTGNIAYILNCSNITISDFSMVKESIKVYTYLSVKDTGIELYGFSTQNEREMFFKLISVPKVGAKIALSILSLYTASELTVSIIAQDSAVISKASGVGKKLAENIVLNLKDKFSTAEIDTAADFPEREAYEPDDDIRHEALVALSTLGFERNMSVKLINKAYEEGITIEELISRALQAAGK